MSPHIHDDVFQKQYKIKRTIFPAMLFAVIFAHLLIYYPLSHANIVSFIQMSILSLLIIALLYKYVSALLNKNVSVLFLIIVFAVSCTVIFFIYYTVLEYDIISYPDFVYPHMLPLNAKIAIFYIYAAGEFCIARALYLFVNTDLISIDKYNNLINNYDSEMKAIQMQSNPHFLYNALSFLNTIIQKDDFDKASQFCSDITHLINRQLHYSDADVISIEEELDWIQHYIRLELFKIHTNIELSIDVEDKDLYISSMPPMLLHPMLDSLISLKPNKGKNSDIIKIDISITSEAHNQVLIVMKNSIPIDKHRFSKSILLINMERKLQLINELNRFAVSFTQEFNSNETIYKLNICDKMAENSVNAN